MRFTALLSSIPLLLPYVFALQDTQSPNEALPFSAPSPRSLRPVFIDLLKRQSTCASGYTSCASLSASDACCPSNTNCARDAAGHVACCPKNYVCTGVIYGTSSGSLSTATGTGTTVIGGVVTITSTAGATATGTTALTAPVTITAGSVVANNYYAYPYILTTYANSAACASAYAFCQSESTSCYNQLAGQNGVTVSNALGSGGTTVQAVTGLVQSSASSICSSLSLTACYGLQSTQCAVFGSTGATTRNRAEKTACPGMRYVAGAGLGAMAVGMAV